MFGSILPIASVVTEKAWEEFLLLKFSFELYHQAEWYVSCDQKVAKLLERFENVVPLPLIDHDECDHNTTNQKQKAQWMRVMMTKFDACEKALRANNRVIFLDSDMLFVNSLGSEFSSLFHYGNVDALLCPHMTGDHINEGKHGYFNAGMFALKSRAMLDDWRELSSMWEKTGYYFEQKPLEFVKNRYFTINLPITYNFGWWRVFLGQDEACFHRKRHIRVEDNVICFYGKPLVNFHTHMLKENVSDAYSGKMRDLVLEKLKEASNPRYRKILEHYESFRNNKELG